jgi:5-methylcytosine-specific restriction endonuclease McrA
VQNNPITGTDPDGHCCDFDAATNFAAGAYNAYTSDNLFGANRQQQTTAAGRIGAAVGDFAATVTGTVEFLGGGTEALATAPAALTGVGILVPAAGAGVALHGSSAATLGFSNLFRNATEEGMQPKQGEKGGPGAGKDIPDKTKAAALEENKAANGGQAKCVFCGEPVGERTGNKINYDHAEPKSQGGNNSLNNVNVACEYCNKSKGTGTEPKNPKPSQNAQTPKDQTIQKPNSN